MAEIRVELRDFTDGILGNLDITSSDDFPLSLSFQNFDVRDFNSRSGSFSKTFKIPASKNNNRLFNHIYRDGNIDNNNVLKNIPSTIYADNIPIITGKLRVTQIYKNTEVLEYECIFLGDNMDWADAIKNLNLDELEFSSTAYSEYPNNDPKTPFSYTDPSSSYGNYIFNQDQLVYPVLSVGEKDSTAPAVIDSDYVPCVFIKNVWDKIFQEQGYSVTSTFCDSAFFKNLIMPLIFEKPSEYTDFSLGKVSMSADETIYQFDTADYNATIGGSVVDNNFTITRAIDDPTITTQSNSDDHKLEFVMSSDTLVDDAPAQGGLDTDDYGNAQLGLVHTSDGNFENGLVVAAQGSGVFNLTGSLTVEVSFDIDPTSGTTNSIDLTGDSELQIYAALKKVGTDDDTDDFISIVESPNYGSDSASDTFIIGHSAASGFGIHTSEQFQFQFDEETNLDEGDKVALIVHYVHRRSGSDKDGDYLTRETVKVLSGSFLQIEQTSAFFSGEDIGNIQYLLPKGKQSDFVKGIAQLFNLQFETDPIAKIVYVEPYDYFYNGTASAYNWTDKIDYSKNIKDEFLYELKSNMIFKYKDPSSDALIERYNKKNTVDWGAYEETDATGNLQNGEYKVENAYFSPTFNWYEPSIIYSPHIARVPLIPMYHTDFTDLVLSSAVERPEKEFAIGARILLKGGGLYSSTNGKRTWTYVDSDNDPSTGAAVANKTWNKATFVNYDNLVSTDDPNDDPATNTLSELTISDGHQTVDYNLSFADIRHETVVNGTYTKSGLYSNYYTRMVEQLRNNPRIKVVYINLEKSDIQKLDFRKLVFIDGIYYRINKIIDFKPHHKESTKVELQEFFNLGKSDAPASLYIDAENLRM